MKIDDLEISQKDKNLLRDLSDRPKSIAQCAAILKTSYNYAATKLAVLVAMEYIKKIKQGKSAMYYLDQDKVEL